MRTITLFSSCGHLEVDYLTGEVLELTKIDNQPDYLDGILCFDINYLTKLPDDWQDCDILSIGFWTKEIDYVPAEEEYLLKDDKSGYKNLGEGGWIFR